MKKKKTQTIYLAYIEQDFSIENGMTGHVIEAKGHNCHDEEIPIWSDIKYSNYEINNPTSFNDFYIGIGPCNEPCLIFKELKEAIRTLFIDMQSFTYYSYRMHMYDVLRPMLASDEMDIKIILHDKHDNSYKNVSVFK